MLHKTSIVDLPDTYKYALRGGLVGIIDSAMDAIIMINEHLRIILFNPAAEDMFGYEAAQVLGSRVDRFIPERFREAQAEYILKFGETGETSRKMSELGELCGLRINGEEFPIEASISQVTVGGIKLFSLILRDITERKRAEEALKESQRREHARRIELETLMETVPLPVWVSYDRDCKIMTGNKAAYELTNLPAGSNISETAPDGKPHFTAYKDGQLVAGEDLPMQKAARTGNPTFDEELEFRFVDGRSKWVYGNAVPLRDENGNAYGAIGAFMDITGHKQMETAIEASERKFRAVYEQAPLGIALHNSKTGQFLQVNQKYCEFIGRTQEELLKIDFQTVTHPDDLQTDLNNMELLREGKIPSFNMEKRYIRPDGSIIWGLLTVVPMWQEGEPSSIHIAMVMDITERKRAEEVLRVSKERYYNLFNTIDEGYCIIEMIFDSQGRPADFRFLEVNAAFGKQTGWHEAEGKSICELAPEIEAYWFDIFGKVALTGEPIRFAKEARALNRWYDVYAYRIGRPQDRQVAVLFNNITDRKHAEERIKQINEELKRSNKDLLDFAYLASHDLKEPLRAVNGFMEILNKRYGAILDDKAREFINIAVKGGQRMDTMLTGLLRYSRLQAQDKPFVLTPMQAAFDGAIANLVASITESHAVITCDPLPSVKADGTQLLQLFQNLIGNAIKFRSEQRPEIHVGFERQGDYWQFCVRDNGIGISPDSYDQVFMIFQQLNPADKYSGHGVGLAICKKIVERHGGKIWVESQPQKGSTFYFTMPA